MLESPIPTDLKTDAWSVSRTLPDYLYDPKWELFQRRLDQTLTHLASFIGPSISTLRTSNGKQLRPVLVFASAALFRSPQEQTIQAALAAELIHLASLVHDDVIDHASLRRSQPSLNALYGNHAAVLSGDALFAEAFRVLSSPGLTSVMPHFIEAIQAMCRGEVQQGRSQFDPTRSIKQYLHNTCLKTGALIEASCRAGAETSGANRPDVEKLGEFGKSLGIAFQIVDDLLDLVGKEDHLGKPVHHDLGQGNLTLPIIYLLQDPTYGNWCKEAMASKPWKTTLVLQIQKAAEQCGALERSQQLAQVYVAKAKDILAGFPPSPATVILAGMADRVLARVPNRISEEVES